MSRTLNKNDIKTLALSSLGGTLEFYDFIIFVFFSSYIAQNFFPKDLSVFWQLFNTYGVFAAGYLARPLGGIILAHFGDKFGRKRMFMISILLMVLPTFALAFVPTYQTIGYWCLVILLLIRICQGIAIGGELPGAWVFVYEHAPLGYKRTYLGILTASVVGGILLGCFIFLIMTYLFTQEQLILWAWRVPFFIGGIFGIVSVHLRKYLKETPVFERMKNDKALAKFPLKHVFKNAKSGVVLSMLITWVLTGCIVVMILFVPGYMSGILHIDSALQTYLQICGIVAISLGCISSGMLADRLGILRSCLIFGVGFGISSLLFFNNLYHTNASFSLCVSWYVISCFFAGVMNFCPLMMSEVFDDKFKFSGLSFSYNISYAIAGGITPQLALLLHLHALDNLNNFWSLSLGMYVFSLSLIALICAFYFKLLSNRKYVKI